jgi:hypothetical protein
MLTNAEGEIAAGTVILSSSGNAEDGLYHQSRQRPSRR